MSEIIVQNNSKDKCFSFGSLFVGSTGGAALGYLTKVFDPKKPVDKMTIAMTSDSFRNNRYLKPLQNIQLGGNFYWRVGGQVVGAMVLYSYLECKFQGGWSKRSLVDCMFAGAITGGAFALSGVPLGGGSLKTGAALGAGGFAAYAGIMYLLFRRTS